MPPRRSEQATDQLRASLIEHAIRLIRRDGPDGLTMRALAAEAGCAVGLPYTVFASRDALVVALVARELSEITGQLEAWAGRAGQGTVAGQLDGFAGILLDADAPALALAGTLGDEALGAAITEEAVRTGLARAFDRCVSDYLAAEQRRGRVRADVDVRAMGFVVTGAVHNLVHAGAAFPRPTRRQLRRHLAAVADLMTADPA